MGASRVLTFTAFFVLLIVGTASLEETVGVDDAILRSEDLDSTFKLEIEQLKSKISSLESSMLEKARELQVKDEEVAKVQRSIQEKEASIALLQGKIELLQKKSALDAEDLVGKAEERSSELQKKVEELKNEIIIQNRKRDTLQARTIEAEKKVQELDLKLRGLEKINGEQKQKIQKTERAFQVAEEELARVKREASSKFKELNEVHGAWLPPWLAYHLVRCQEVVTAHWNEHGKPVWRILVQKVAEKSGQVQKWFEPHLETAKTKWIPIMKDRWITFTRTVRPHMDKTSAKAVEILNICRATTKSHVFTLKELANPYVQVTRKFIKPYVDLIATITKPYVSKASTFLKPYTRKVVRVYGKFLGTAKTYHHQAQKVVLEKLEKHELTKSLATNEFVWFTASASLALPIFFVYNVLSKIFGKKVTKPVRSTRSHNHHRRHKRRHADQ